MYKITNRGIASRFYRVNNCTIRWLERNNFWIIIGIGSIERIDRCHGINKSDLKVLYKVGNFSIEVGINVDFTRSFYRLNRDFAALRKLNPFVRASLREKSSEKFRRVADTRHNYSSSHGSTSLLWEKKLWEIF